MKATSTGFNPEYSNDEPTREDIAGIPGPAVLEFGAPWCGHCQAAAPVVGEALSRHPDLPHIKVHDGKGKALGRAFGVKFWPTLIFLQDGEEVSRLVRPRDPGPVVQALASIT